MRHNANNELKKLDEYYPNSDLKHIYVKHRDEIAILLKTIETVWENQKLSKDDFNILFKGLQNSWVVVYYYVVGEPVNSMIGKIDGIEKLIYKGIEDKNWKTRLNTTIILKGIDNNELKCKIIEIALKDKSQKVREMAIDVQNNSIHSTTNITNSTLPKAGRTWLQKLFGSE